MEFVAPLIGNIDILNSLSRQDVFQWRIQGEESGDLNPPFEPKNKVGIPRHSLYMYAYIINFTCKFFFFNCAPHLSDNEWMNEYLYFNTLASSTEVDFHERLKIYRTTYLPLTSKMVWH